MESLGGGIVSYHIIRAGGLLLDGHLRCYPRLCLLAGLPACLRHPAHLRLMLGDKCDYYIIIRVPMRLKK